jgi:hypothetical protein
MATELMANDFKDTLIYIDKKNKRRRKREFFVVMVPDNTGATGSPIEVENDNSQKTKDNNNLS